MSAATDLTPPTAAAPAPAPARLDPRRSRALAITLGFSQLVGWGTTYFAFPAFIGPIRAHLGWSAGELTAGLTLCLIICDLVSIPAGVWFDRRGGRGVMTLGATVAALALAMLSQVETLTGFFVAMSVLGVAQGLSLNNIPFAVVAANAHDYRRSLNLMTVIGGLSASAALPVSGYLAVHWGWRETLLLLSGVHLLVCGLAVFVALRGTRGSQSHESAAERAARPSPLGAALRRSAFWLLVVAFSVNWFVNAAISIHGLLAFQEWGLSLDQALAVTALIGPATVLARLATLTFWPGASGVRTGLWAFALYASAMIWQAGLGREGWLALAVFAVAYGAASGVLVLARLTALAEIFGLRGYGAVSSALSTAAIAARTGSPLVVSMLHDALGGYRGVAITLVGLALLGFAAFALASRAPRADMAAQNQ